MTTNILVQEINSQGQENNTNAHMHCIYIIINIHYGIRVLSDITQWTVGHFPGSTSTQVDHMATRSNARAEHMLNHVIITIIAINFTTEISCRLLMRNYL